MTGARRGRYVAPVAAVTLLLVSAVSPVVATSRASVDAPSATIAHDGDAVSLQAGPGQVVTGETNLPPGTALHVTIRGDSGTAFILSEESVVGTDGEFAAVFDASMADVGSEVDVTVRFDGERLAATSGTIVECRGACAAPSPESPTATVDDGTDGLGLTAGPGRVVTGETNLPPGTSLTVRASEQTGDNATAVTTTRATVTDTGSFRAVLNLSDALAEAPHRLSIQSNGTELEAADLEIDPCTTACERPPTTGDSQEAVLERRAHADDLNVYEGTQGETVRIPVTFGPSEATLTVGGDNMTYALEMELHDGDDDNRVVVALDTDAIGPGNETVSAVDDADSVRVVSERGQANRSVLAAGQYLLTQRPGAESRPGSHNAADHGVLTVRDADDRDGVVESFGFPVVRQDGEYAGMDPVTTSVGQTARIPFQTDEVDVAAVAVGTPHSGFFLNATVEDGNGDERVTLLLNTSTAANESSGTLLTTAAPEDSVSVQTRRGTLEAAEYDLRGYIVTSNQTSEDSNVQIWSSSRFIVGERGETPTVDGNDTEIGVFQDPTSPGGPSSPSNTGRVLPFVLLALGGLFGIGGVLTLSEVFERE